MDIEVSGSDVLQINEEVKKMVVKMKKVFSVLLVCTLAVTMLLVAGSTGCAAEAYSAYVMGYFTESPNGDENRFALHLAYSTDGLNWTPLNQNQPVVTPTLGYKGLRDPFILRKQDGTFVVMATNMIGQDMAANLSKYILIWDSADLRTFTNERLLQVNNSSTMHAWAPEAFWDASKSMYAILWAGNTDRNRIYVSYTTDFKTVTNYNTLTVFHDPGVNIYDGDMLMYNGTNYFYNANGKIHGYKSTSLNPGNFTNNYVPSLVAGNAIEAPTQVQKINANTWWLWGDSYSPSNPVFYCWQSSDISTNSWTLMDKKFYEAPLNGKHCTIAKVTTTELNNIITKWGNPSWNRMKSYNFPDRFWRHSNFAGRIDSEPIDPVNDSKWKMVAGLADSSGVSFESVSYPGYYLRHSNYVISLVKNDGTSTFKADATFYKTAGFADSAWTSFKSYNYPDRYIRHSNYVLRIDPVTSSSSTSDKQDATFRIGY